MFTSAPLHASQKNGEGTSPGARSSRAICHSAPPSPLFCPLQGLSVPPTNLFRTEFGLSSPYPPGDYTMPISRGARPFPMSRALRHSLSIPSQPWEVTGVHVSKREKREAGAGIVLHRVSWGAHGTAGTGVHVFWVLLTFWSRMAPLMGYFVFFSAFWPTWL